MNGWNPKANGIFQDAVERPSGDERRSFLDEACAGNEPLLREVEALLRDSWLGSRAESLVSRFRAAWLDSRCRSLLRAATPSRS